MKTKVYLSLLVILLSLPIITIEAQLRGSNIAEYQLGNIPGINDPSNQSSLYNQLNLNYRYKQLKIFTRAELYSSSLEDHSATGKYEGYSRISQYRLSYKTKMVNLEVGHLYTSLGRGLLMRNYEIPSSIFEERGNRVRYGFYKDLYGISAKFKSKYVNLKVVRGDVLSAELPPTFSEKERRTDLVEGAEIDANYKGQTLGLIYMRHHQSGIMNDYASIYYNGNIKGFTIYGELAKQLNDSVRSVTSFTIDDAYGGYLGVNYSWESIGFSLEYKDYKNFIIGNGVNDPPTLIKEHSSRLLNRSTHVPLLVNESGYQAEIFYTFGNGSIVTFNHALARNGLARDTTIFREYYIDLTTSFNSKIQTRFFVDYAIDPFESEFDRYTGGANIGVEHGKYSSTVDVELQYIKREILEEKEILNMFISYTFTKASKFSVSALLEVSSDPFLFEDEENQVFYPSIAASYQFGKKNKLTAFYGKRRGGPACTSGVCYDVLDFEGLELRLNSRF